MELYLGTMLRQVDSSLLDEWEKMRDPSYASRIVAERAAIESGELRPPSTSRGSEEKPDVTRDPKTFTAAVRNTIFTFLRGLVIGDFEAALGQLNSNLDEQDEPWTSDRLKAAMEQYHTDHQRLCLDPNARNIRHTYVTPAEDKRSWRVQQMLVDPEGNNDWVAEFDVDLPQSRENGVPWMRLRRLGSLVR
jgi:hypothetical protein